MENLRGKQELRPSESSLKTRVPPPQQAQKHRTYNEEPEL